MQRAKLYPHSKPTRALAGWWKSVKGAWWCYLFLFPWVVLNIAFVIYPQGASYPYTLYNWDGIGQPSGFVGFDNFVRVAQDPYFWAAFRNTFVYAVVLVPIQLALALVLALVLDNPKLRFSNFYRAVFFSPAVTSAAIVSIIIGYIFNQMGTAFSSVMQFLGVVAPGEQVNILADPRFTLNAIIVVGIWKTLGLNMVNFLAALQSIPKELYEAARIDGANPQQEFWHITIPMLRSPGLIITFLAFVGSLSVFDLALVLAGSGSNAILANAEVVSTYIFRNAFGESNNVGFATAAALFMGFVVMGISLIQVVVYRLFGVQQRSVADRISGKGA